MTVFARPWSAEGSRAVRLAVAGIAIAGAAGVAVASGGTMQAAVTAAAAVAFVAPIVWIWVRPRVGLAFSSIELPVILLLASTLVLRIRDAATLAADPVDSAGAYRIICVGLAGLLGALALTRPGVAVVDRVTTRAFRVYLLYIFVVFLGAPLSVDPPLTAFRGGELLVGAIVLCGAIRVAGGEGVWRIAATLYWWVVGNVATLWLGALIAPGEAFISIDSPIPVQLNGVWPSISANGAGTLGGLLALWSMALLASRRERAFATRSVTLALVFVGLVTVVFAQYRTGYVGVVVGVVVMIALKNRAALAWAAIGVAIVALLWGGQIVQDAQPVALRGQTTTHASELSSRVYWWSHAIPLWEESPIVGAGLLTGTRFEVLAELGSVTTSSIHGTWIEALVGTGVLGLACLIVFVVLILARAVRATGRDSLVPGVLFAFMLVRSATGATFEVFGLAALIAMMLALDPRDEPARATAPRAALERTFA